MTLIGLDLSITSTGVCIYDTDTKDTIYYIIGNKFTKKALAYNCEYLHMILYKKDNPINDENHVKELCKTNNIYNIICKISDIIDKHRPSIATIEGVSFNSRGSVLDLCGLNYMVRMLLIQKGIKHINIVAPTQNKKFATANGQAEKDVMISAWHKSDKKTTEIPSYIKTDDIADAYFLARYGKELIINEK